MSTIEDQIRAELAQLETRANALRKALADLGGTATPKAPIAPVEQKKGLLPPPKWDSKSKIAPPGTLKVALLWAAQAFPNNGRKELLRQLRLAGYPYSFDKQGVNKALSQLEKEKAITRTGATQSLKINPV